MLSVLPLSHRTTRYFQVSVILRAAAIPSLGQVIRSLAGLSLWLLSTEKGQLWAVPRILEAQSVMKRHRYSVVVRLPQAPGLCRASGDQHGLEWIHSFSRPWVYLVLRGISRKCHPRLVPELT